MKIIKPSVNKKFVLKVLCKELNIDLELKYYDKYAMRRQLEWYSNYFNKKKVKQYDLKEGIL